MMDITCIFLYNMLLKMFNKYNPVVNEVILEIIFFTSRLHVFMQYNRCEKGDSILHSRKKI